MSGDDTRELDLDAILERARTSGAPNRTEWVGAAMQVTGEDVPALVAEVRRLRALVSGEEFDLDAIEARARAAAERNGEYWWTVRLGSVEDSDGTIVEGSATPGNPRAYSDSPELWDHEGALGMFSETALHVATMNPGTTLALVAEVRRLRAKVERGPF